MLSIVILSMMLIIDQIDCGRYPYKPVYGPPVECTLEQKEAFDYCEIKALRYYGTKIDDFYINSLGFCCFVWYTLQCEIDVARGCNNTYAMELKQSTINRFESFCHDQPSYEQYTSIFRSCFWHKVGYTFTF
ncbi:uncharacterized protein LOC124491289 [Dermatophagoides farinae]|uniref:uncharacterized protein LOC124491289 n=1 Tax=Dermatophagoides farinae TaxID=6954 RepID=UPI003F639FAB